MNLEPIFNAISARKCVAFLGAGASTGYESPSGSVAGIPTGGQIAEVLAKACDYRNGSVYDLARVAEFFAFRHSGHRDGIEREIRQQIGLARGPRPIHTVLAQLRQIRYFVTTNYDLLMEDAFRECHREFTRHVYDRKNPRTAHLDYDPEADDPPALLHKMHGSIDDSSKIVITQSDYIRTPANVTHPDLGMPEYLRKTTFSTKTLLFLGYSLEDWNLRVIWEGVLASHHESGTAIKSYALVREPSDFLQEFWRDRGVRVIDCDLTEFARQLSKHFNLEIPQLGVARRNEGGPG